MFSASSSVPAGHSAGFYCVVDESTIMRGNPRLLLEQTDDRPPSTCFNDHAHSYWGIVHGTLPSSSKLPTRSSQTQCAGGPGAIVLPALAPALTSD